MWYFFLLVEPHQKGSVGHGSVSRYKPPEGSPEGVPFSERASLAAERSEALTERKRGSTEPPPREARLREGHRDVAITKISKRFHQKAQGNHLYI